MHRVTESIKIFYWVVWDHLGLSRIFPYIFLNSYNLPQIIARPKCRPLKTFPNNYHTEDNIIQRLKLINLLSSNVTLQNKILNTQKVNLYLTKNVSKSFPPKNTEYGKLILIFYRERRKTQTYFE